MIKVTIWNEFIHEKNDPEAAGVYPKGIHTCIAEFLGTNEEFSVRTATLDQPEHGLTEDVLLSTDVLIWWGHMGHHLVSDEVVSRIQQRVLCGMGLIVLHSGHHSKIFKRLMGTSGNLSWREADYERLWTISPSHPIAKGVETYIEIGSEEMYGERFDIPQPDELVFIGWFSGGEIMRSGCCWTRGLGRVFYFQPGHETYPTYHNPSIQRIITNAVRWANPDHIEEFLDCPKVSVSPEMRRIQNQSL